MSPRTPLLLLSALALTRCGATDGGQGTEVQVWLNWMGGLFDSAFAVSFVVPEVNVESATGQLVRAVPVHATMTNMPNGVVTIRWPRLMV